MSSASASFVVPVGRYQGRTLSSLTVEERRGLKRTRTPALEQARVHLDELTAAASSRPPPGRPADEPPAPCLPLAIRAGPPRWPPPPLHEGWPRRIKNTPAWLTFIQLGVAAYLMCLIHPPLAEYPGWLLGYGLRCLGLRMAEVWKHFTFSLAAEIKTLFVDFVEWLENMIWPFAPTEPGPHPPGQRLAAVGTGLFAFSVWRRAM